MNRKWVIVILAVVLLGYFAFAQDARHSGASRSADPPRLPDMSRPMSPPHSPDAVQPPIVAPPPVVVTPPPVVAPPPPVVPPPIIVPPPNLPRTPDVTHSPDMTRPSGPTHSPDIVQPSGPAHSPDVMRPSVPSHSPNLSRTPDVTHSPDMTRPSGPTHSPDIARPSGPAHSPDTSRPSGPPQSPDTSQPSGPPQSPDTSQPSVPSQSSPGMAIPPGSAPPPAVLLPPGGMRPPDMMWPSYPYQPWPSDVILSSDSADSSTSSNPVYLSNSSGASSSLDAAAIVEKSRSRIKADTISTRSKMVLTAKNGTTTERTIDQYSKKDGKGNNRAVIVFQDPASVKGTRFLTLENPGKDNDQWIYLPSLGKVRRIAASEGSGSFMGSDFSYDDISSADRNAGLDNHSIIREEKFRTKDCYVIQSVPKDSGYQYSKMIQWIDKENFVTYKVELYDKRGTQVKLLEIPELKEVQGRLAAMTTKMTTLASGTSTTLNVTILKYDDPIPEGVFTTNYLETGRP